MRGYVRTWEGWLYVATVLDVFSRRADRLGRDGSSARHAGVCDALRMAVATRGRRVAGVIFHSAPAAASTRRPSLARSVTRTGAAVDGQDGGCWDNALAESFFATVQLELIEPATWPTRTRARTATVHWLEAVYNRQRRHSAIDMQSPVDYEERYWDRRTAA
jgi:transposase InsO family protein